MRTALLHEESSSTARRTTVNLALSSATSLVAAGISIASLVKDRDLRLNRPHSRLVVAMEVAQVCAIGATLARNGLAVYRRQNSGYAPMDRQSEKGSTQLLVSTVVVTPVVSALQLRRILRGTTSRRGYRITRIGKIESSIALIGNLLALGTAAGELYSTRKTRVPELKAQAAGLMRLSALAFAGKTPAPAALPDLPTDEEIDDLATMLSTMLIDRLGLTAENMQLDFGDEPSGFFPEYRGNGLGEHSSSREHGEPYFF